MKIRARVQHTIIIYFGRWGSSTLTYRFGESVIVLVCYGPWICH